MVSEEVLKDSPRKYSTKVSNYSVVTKMKRSPATRHLSAECIVWNDESIHRR
jgi:hypothetical protein